MSIRALQDYTLVSKYARYNKEAKRRETFKESIDRVKQMHLRKFPQLKKEIDWSFSVYEEQRVLGSQRALQFGGIGIERVNARGYNCTSSHCDRLRFFQEAFWLLLCGCGVGFSVQKKHVSKLPRFTSARINKTSLEKKAYEIPDSIEGWADSLGVLLSSYFDDPVFPEYANCDVEFYFGKIREKGSILSTSSGKAPGPEPLRKALYLIRDLLERCLALGLDRLRPIDAYDIVMHASDAVLSGGVRRSACISIFSFDDEEMLKAKTGNWFVENPQRGRSNNSVMLLRHKVVKEQFMGLLSYVKEFGEPGFVWADDDDAVFNPCLEIAFNPIDPITGKTGWAFCNLSEINGKKVRSKEDFRKACRAATIIGTIQAGYTSFPYLGEPTENIAKHEALIGVGITGMMENPDIIFDPEIQREMANYVKEVNLEISELIGINPAARCTCVKPSGTTSCLLGTSSGVHPHHSRRYFRKVQSNRMEPPFQHFEKENPLAVEDSVWSANKTDAVITFCIEIDKDALTKQDVNAVSLLKYVRSTQQNWVLPGTRKERCISPWLANNVSNTINVKPDEWETVGEFIYDNREYFTGVSLLSDTGDLDYPQAPFTAVYDTMELEGKYGEGSKLCEDLIKDGVALFDNLWKACDYILYDRATEDINKIEWIEKTRIFAKNYFNGDLKKATYCLKEVHNWNTWCILKESYKNVDYTLMHEEEDNTKPIEAAACAGGVCQVTF